MLIPCKVNAVAYEDVMRAGAEEAMRVQLINNQVSQIRYDTFKEMNAKATMPLDADDILIPFFIRYSMSNVVGNDPMSKAYKAWSMNLTSVFKRYIDEARQLAFILTVQQQGKPTQSFSPISTDEYVKNGNVLMPFFHIMLLQHDHKRIEKAALKGERINCGSAIERAFVWFHMDMVSAAFAKKSVNVEQFLLETVH